MRIGPRAQLLLIAALFALPMAASFIAYYYVQPAPTGNYGELLSPPLQPPTHAFPRPDAPPLAFSSLAGRWVIVMSDSGACNPACAEKLEATRKVRLALGRNASRVERVFVADDSRPPDARMATELEGAIVALVPAGLQMPPAPANDRAHIYLVDPRGNVMMRWPARPDRKRMLKDLERLLKASQIG